MNVYLVAGGSCIQTWRGWSRQEVRQSNSDRWEHTHTRSFSCSNITKNVLFRRLDRARQTWLEKIQIICHSHIWEAESLASKTVEASHWLDQLIDQPWQLNITVKSALWGRRDWAARHADNAHIQYDLCANFYRSAIKVNQQQHDHSISLSSVFLDTHSFVPLGLLYCCVGGGIEKVNSILISPSQPEPPPVTVARTEMETAAERARTPTCAAHSAVQMRPHFSAAHFVDVVSSSIVNVPLQAAEPERQGGVHRVLRSGHPAVCLRGA